ncbi:MAG: hypothetical protein JWN70_4316 [Planctomycetaceae bacterium]|nr:hypothetical protein [Planctomycetaceae bacterium]
MIDVRCDEHVGEAFPPRCLICESLAAEHRFLGIKSEAQETTSPDRVFEAYVARIVAEAPPLTDHQRDVIRAAFAGLPSGR